LQAECQLIAWVTLINQTASILAVARGFVEGRSVNKRREEGLLVPGEKLELKRKIVNPAAV